MKVEATIHVPRTSVKQKRVTIVDTESRDYEIPQRPRKIVKKNPILLQPQSDNQYAHIQQVPTVYLTNTQMKGDPIKLFVELEKKYYQFGAVKIVASPDWNPPFSFGFTDKGITTRIQHIHKLMKGKAFSEKEQAYNILSFKSMAQNFERNYKYRINATGDTPQLKNEKQYWSIVSGSKYKEDPRFKVSVEYAADLPVVKYGSGFPQTQSRKSKDDNFDYCNSFFNLNNIYKSSLSILKMASIKKQYISGVTSPWMYMGMMFSTFCWHVEDLWLNSLNYSHKGAVKTWYIIPACDKQKFDEYIKNKTNNDDMLDGITFMIDPLQLKREGIKVYKLNQHPKQYVCTFFKAYHCGFSNGFNVGEAVNFVSPYSLAYMKQAIDYYTTKKSKKPLVMPLQWLIYANKAHSKDYGTLHEIIDEEYKNLLQTEKQEIKSILKKCAVDKIQEFSDGCKYDKNACTLCRKYMYLWFIRCMKCGHSFCLKHAHSCCGSLSLCLRELTDDRKSLKKILTSR